MCAWLVRSIWAPGAERMRSRRLLALWLGIVATATSCQQTVDDQNPTSVYGCNNGASTLTFEVDGADLILRSSLTPRSEVLDSSSLFDLNQAVADAFETCPDADLLSPLNVAQIVLELESGD